MSFIELSLKSIKNKTKKYIEKLITGMNASYFNLPLNVVSLKYYFFWNSLSQNNQTRTKSEIYSQHDNSKFKVKLKQNQKTY